MCFLFTHCVFRYICICCWGQCVRHASPQALFALGEIEPGAMHGEMSEKESVWFLVIGFFIIKNLSFCIYIYIYRNVRATQRTKKLYILSARAAMDDLARPFIE